MIFNYKVLNKDNNKTIREYLQSFYLAKKRIYKLFNEKRIFINGNIAKENDKVYENDDILIEQIEEANFKPIKRELDIVFEDDYLLVVSKMANQIIYSLDNEEALANNVAYYYQVNNYDIAVKYVHRIDKETTGLVVFCKDELSFSYLNHLMENQEIEKYYLLFVSGILNKKEDTIKLSIGSDRHNNNKMVINNKENYGITEYKVLQEYKTYSLVEAKIITGKTHQIRVSFSYLKHPVLGDTLYNGKKSLIQRVALHSYKVKFIHPVFNEEIVIKTDMPLDMKKLGGNNVIW